MAWTKQVQRTMDNDFISAKEAFDEYIVEKEANNLSEDSILAYNKAWKHFKRWLDIDKDKRDSAFCIEDITKDIIIKWKKDLLKMKKKNGEPISIRTANHDIGHIRTFLYWCMDDERQYIKKPYKIDMLSYQESAPKHYSQEDIEKLIKKPSKSEGFITWRSWAIIVWIYGTGMRSRSLRNIKLCDIDFDNNEIQLRETKTKRYYSIPLSHSLKLAIKEYIRMWRTVGTTGDDYLFPTISNTQMCSVSVWEGVKEFAESRGVEKTGVHALRHSFAINWVRNKGNMFTLQKMLGHTTLDMTRNYVKMSIDDIKVDFEEHNPLDVATMQEKQNKTVRRTK